MPSQIPTIFKPTGVSFCQNVINNLSKDDILTLVLDPDNKFDQYAIKITNSEGLMCGFVPRKMTIKKSDKSECEIELNKLLHEKFTRISKKFDLKVLEIYKWDGPTGYDVIFEKKKKK